MNLKTSTFLACTFALLVLLGCRSANHSDTNISATADSTDGIKNPDLVQSKPSVSQQPAVVPITVQADVKAPEKIAIPIAIKTDAPETAQVQVALKLTNSSSEQLVLPIRFQFDTNVQSITLAAPFSGTNSAPHGLSTNPFKLQWRGNEPFWLMLFVIGIVLAWAIGNLDKVNAVPQRALPAACAIIATIHFYNSSGRADWVLIVILAVGAAPWLSKYIKSISQKGIEFATQGSVPSAPQPQAPLDFNSLSYHEKKILATLWKYQRQVFGDKREPRWTFIVLNESPSNMAFSLGCLGLFGKNLAGTAPSGQVLLSDHGFDFCAANAAQMANWNDTYNNFSAS
jgi:hypothetical protein